MNDKIEHNISEEMISRARRLCHRLCFESCVQEKKRGAHLAMLRRRPHWSELTRDEQFRRIDRGEEVPFDISLPLPAKDEREGSDAGVRLFWESFSCERCGRCCFTPGAGLFLDGEDYDRIAKRIGKKRLRSLTRYEKAMHGWALKQPCPFYDPGTGCTIYDIRPETCKKYPLHPPSEKMPNHLAVDAFCPAARALAKDTLGWWIICENHWASLLEDLCRSQSRSGEI